MTSEESRPSDSAITSDRGAEDNAPAQTDSNNPPEPTPEQRERVLLEMAASAYFGPMPSPETFERLEALVPGSADRILRMAEEQQAHRMKMEDLVIRSDVGRANWGLALGFVLAFVVLAGAIGLIAIGRSVEGLLTLVTAVSSLLGIYFKSTSERAKERADKAQVMGPGAAYGAAALRGRAATEQVHGKPATDAGLQERQI